MTSENVPPAKYHVEMNQSQGTVIGDHNVVLQHFHAAAHPVTRDELLATIHEANAELRAYPGEIAGIHVERTEVAEIVTWIHQADPKEQLGVIVDQPGSGKTVVMHDVLIQLEGEKLPVLAIKADYLSGIKDQEHLAKRLGLPASVEVCARTLAAEGLFIVLLDQLDALSLALSRDQATLDAMLSMLVHLRGLDNVRIVASCRTFDLNNDPRLSRLKVDKTFTLQPWTNEQVDRVLQAVGVDSTHLLPAHRTLLATPLHLDVYARVVAADSFRQPPESFYNLQELYEALWQKRIKVVPPDSPPPSERSEAIYRLVDTMQNKRQLAAPIAVLDDYAEATVYLERVNFIRREGRTWLFFHQTLFDYCYARRFVAQNRSLSEEILSGSQGLFERSQMVQILAYLRGVDAAAYRRELTALLFADTLRVHLRLLLMGWFGALPDPTADELQIARQLIRNVEHRVRFFRAISGNAGWFDHLKRAIIPTMLRSSQKQEVNLAIGHLASMIQHQTQDVITLLRPFLGTVERWDEQISYCLTNLELWHHDEAVDILCDLFSRRRTFDREEHYFRALQTNPAAGCRVLSIHLNLRLDDIIAQLEQAEQHEQIPENRSKLSDWFTWERHLLGDYAVNELLKRAVFICPDKVVEHIMPWFVRASIGLSESNSSQNIYPTDPQFSAYWYDEHASASATFARLMGEALQSIAQSNPIRFRSIVVELIDVESLAVQRVLAQGFLANPEEYGVDISLYLLGDTRRLNIGEHLESPRYDSYRLFSAAFQYASVAQRIALESLILELQKTGTYRRIDSTQLGFLNGVPIELLSETARRKRRKLEHKFPGFKLQPPHGMHVRSVPPPIEQDAQSKMTDEAWLGAMRKYDDSTMLGGAHTTTLKGGILQLSRSFSERVKADPRRFYYLAQQFDETISAHYLEATITGLADSDAPAEWIFHLVRQFASRLEEESRRMVCWALEKRASDDIPDDLLAIMIDWALHDPDPTEQEFPVLPTSRQTPEEDNLYQRGINTNRGAAIRAVCCCAYKRKPPQFEVGLRLLEQAAQDPSVAVRTCIVDSLGFFLTEDAERVLAIFIRTINDHPLLLQSARVHHFLWLAYYDHFLTIRPFIEALLHHSDDAARQAGARLACLAAFHHSEAEALSQSVIVGDVAMRRGATQVYARNLEKRDVRVVCRQRLLQLMHDPDEITRKHVGNCFQYLSAEDLDEFRLFIEEFLNSPALLLGARHLIEFLNPLVADEPALALLTTNQILDATGSEIVDKHRSLAMLERDVVKLPIAVYVHAHDPEVKSQALDLFEQLLLLDNRSAHRALADWDRR